MSSPASFCCLWAGPLSLKSQITNTDLWWETLKQVSAPILNSISCYLNINSPSLYTKVRWLRVPNLFWYPLCSTPTPSAVLAVYTSVIITKLLFWQFWRFPIWCLLCLILGCLFWWAIPRTSIRPLSRAQHPQTEFSGGHSCMYTHMLINSHSLPLTKIPCASLLEIPLTIGCVDVSLAVLLLTWPTKENLSSTCSLGKIGLNMQYYF